MSPKLENINRIDAAQILVHLKVKILSEWELRCHNVVPAAKTQNHLALLHSLPEFMDQLIASLRSTESQNEAKKKFEVACEQGEDRARMKEYNLDQVIYEFQVLRSVLIEALEFECHLSPEILKFIHEFLDQGIREAVGKYVETELKEEPATSDTLPGGEIGALIRSFDWSKTSLGPINSWSSGLQTTVSLCLGSNFPINIIWGPEHLQIYNVGYRDICGAYHPKAIGEPFEVTWATAWPVIGKPFERALAGEPSFLENQRIFLVRHGYFEETFFSFSFSPIRDEIGRTVGLFHPVTETTQTMLSQRRTRLLRDIGEKAGETKTLQVACDLALQSISEYFYDVPMALLYLVDGERKSVKLSAASGVPLNSPAAPKELKFNTALTESHHSWPLDLAAVARKPQYLNDIEARFGPIACREYPEVLREAFIFPLGGTGHEVMGFLVLGVSPRLPIDENYSSFLKLLSQAVDGALTNAQLFEKEKRRAETLAEIDRAKTIFFSNVSHEFRTPLTLMLGPLEDNLADSNTLWPEHRERDELAYRNALRLLKLVNSLLDFSRIEAGRVKATYQATDFSKLTNDLASVFRSAIEKGGLKFIVDMPSLGEEVYVDRDMWEKIVLNLLSNAFKFTLHGEIEIKLMKFDDKVHLTVRDTGIGISESELPRLFERFHRVEGAQGRTHEGTGIGLALIQELVKLHGGSISVKSELGKGTQFTVEIPLGTKHLPLTDSHDRKKEITSSFGAMGATFVAEATRWLPNTSETLAPAASIVRADKSPLTSEVTQEKAPRSRVLLADDNVDMRGYLKSLLQAEWDVVAVGDGEAALDSASHNPPDLILSDVMMPKMDGFELIQKLKKNPKTRNVPVVLLSARAGEESRIEGLQGGADDYLVKPFSAKELLARVKTHLQIGKLRSEAINQQEKLYSIFSQAPVGICIFEGPNHVYTLANADYYKLLGGTRDIIGKTIREALPELRNQMFYELLDRVYQTGEPYLGKEIPVEINLQDNSIKKLYVNFNYQPKRSLNGKIDGIIVICTEITEQVLARVQLEASAANLKSAKLDAESANLAKSAFLANMSHEIRTPLGAILGFTDLLKERDLGNEDRNQFLDTISRNGKALTKIIDDILDLAKVESGKLDVENIDFSIFDLIDDVMDVFRERTRAKSIFLRAHLGKETPARILSDPTRIRQILINVIGNAVKFTDAGGVTIDVRTGASVGLKTQFILSVKDTGVGISAAQKERLFQPFMQADNSTTRKYGGTGLGLALSKRLANALGGDIAIEDCVDKVGCTFTVTFLALLPERNVQKPKIVDTEAKKAEKKELLLADIRVLLADDSPDNRVLVEIMLGKKGALVESATNGLEAFRMGMNGTYDVILMDIQMPEMDG
ncbi:MAG: response regulator, partial [Bdellovibrionaceae bacterium]|nr:response regulator [Pseudobdellovibrionaceae bacterium]